MGDSLERRHFARLLQYIWQNKRLLGLTFFFGTLGFLTTFLYPWLIGELIDRVMLASEQPLNERLHTLLWITAGGAVTSVLFTVSGFGRGHYNMLLGNRIVIALRRDLFEHLQSLPLSFFSKNKTGSLVNQLLNELHAVSGLLHTGVILFLLDILQLAIAFVLLFKISPLLTCTVLLVLPGYVLTFYIFNRRVRQASGAVQRAYDHMAGDLQEQFSGVALTKAFAVERREVERLVQDNEEHYRQTAYQSRLGHWMGACSEFFIHIGTAIIIGVGGYMALYSDASITPGDFTRFVGYVGILYGPINRMAHLNTVYQNSLAALRRAFSVFDIRPQVTDSPHAISAPSIRGEVSFENVYFRYDQREGERHGPDSNGAAPSGRERATDGWVLKGVSLNAAPGEKIALVGPSGSGKTTLVSLIPRLYDVASGSVKVDGLDVRSYVVKELRRCMAVVHQEPFLFSGSVRENIAYSDPEATFEKIIESAKAANAHEFIAALPAGYDTMVGERGVLLSGGQKQRISIARAFLRNARILILDEATSALDADSEELIVDALERLMEGKTCFIVAHRLSTIRSADRIFTVSAGQIVEAGDHDKLLMNQGIYAQLFSKQARLLREPPLKRLK